MISFHQKNRQEIWRRRLPGEMMDWEWEGVAGGGRAWKGDWSGVRGRWGRGRGWFWWYPGRWIFLPRSCPLMMGSPLF